MAAEVYFVKASMAEGEASLAAAGLRLAEQSGIFSCFRKHDYAAVKVHVGEKGNETFVRPAAFRRVIERLAEMGAHPFLTDTCTLYTGQRSNGISHAVLAAEHGFNVDVAGAPFIPADGLYGDGEVEVATGLERGIFDKVYVAEAVARAQSLLVVSHVTGHVAAGLGASIKNLGMGCSSRKGKRQQHCSMRPEVKDACVLCGACIAACPAGAVSERAGRAWIDKDTCIGCGQCLAECRFAAVSFDFGVEGTELQRRMAEYALGAVKGKEGRVAFLTYMLSITGDCDCFGQKLELVTEDFGILASTDPVALDQAVLDLATKREGVSFCKLAGKEHLDPRVQIAYGEEIGLGTSDYELVEL